MRGVTLVFREIEQYSALQEFAKSYILTELE
jgi:hypothetical protein